MRAFESALIAAAALVNLTFSFATDRLPGVRPSTNELREIRGGECGNPIILGPACTLGAQDTCSDHAGSLQSCNDHNFTCGYDCNSVHPTFYDISGQEGPVFDIVFKGCGTATPPLYEHHKFKPGCRYQEFQQACHCVGSLGVWVDCGTYRTFGDDDCTLE